MTDHAEEQEMEAEAMVAIFDTHFEIIDPSMLPVTLNNDINGSNQQTYDNHRVWRITIYPETGTTDEQELENINHVGCRLIIMLPETYPEILPIIYVEIIKGLAPEHQIEIHHIAMEEATNNLGTSSIYAITERVREWLIENNTKGLDDISMHAQMMRKKIQEEKSKNKPQTIFETQKHSDEMTEAEREELEVTKRRAEGTPCTKENFDKWQTAFLQEMANKKLQNDTTTDDDGMKSKQRKDKTKDNERTGRMTGFEHFSNKLVDIEALELAAAEAEQGFEADENLFEDDIDLDDMDFDEDDDDDEFDEDDDNEDDD